MSFLTFGLAKIPAVATQPSVAGTKTIRERILDNMVAALEDVHETSNPVAWNDNSSQGVRAASGGAYTGTTPRTYRVTVVGAGVSGVATVTAAVVAGVTDEGPVAAVVTSGVAIVLGIGGLGVTLTLTFSGTLELNDYWDVKASTYQSDILKIFRTEDSRTPRGIYGILREPLEDTTDEPIGMLTKRMTVTITIYLKGQSNPEEKLDDVLGDSEKALMADHTRGGLAIDTTPLTNVAFARESAKSHSGFDMLFEVLYRHRRTDPRLQ